MDSQNNLGFAVQLLRYRIYDWTKCRMDYELEIVMPREIL